MAAPCPCAHREYVRWRARQVAYGRWAPWADAAPVREHVRALRQAGASYEAIARAAGVATMTVRRLLHGEPANGRPVPGRIRAAHAERLLAVTAASLQDAAARRDAAGTRRRLQALIAMGHPAASLARASGIPPRVVWGVVRGATATVSRDVHAAVCVLYERTWDLRPPERNAAERRAAGAARRRAAVQGWPAPMALDDEQIDNPAYRPRARWRPASGAGVTRPADPPGRAPDPRDGQVRRRHPGRDPGLEAVS
jgi:transcriptional regulator with XRE-family HTH domain